MKTFANLINALDTSNKTKQKMAAIDQFLNDAEERDKLSFLALFTGKRPKRVVSTTLLKQWAIQEAAIPEWLFQESYAAVGDLAETISLILPEPETYRAHNLAVWIELIQQLKNRSEEEKRDFIVQSWKGLPHIERFIFNKLLGGSFRIGISSKSLINAIAKHYHLEESAVAHAIMGDWKSEAVSFEMLVKGGYANTQLSKPYPFCLAYSLEGSVEDLGARTQWQIEYKWDGIRGQLIKREGEIFIWSRGEELVTHQFPEITEALSMIEGNFVLDGEILVYQNNRVANFSELQKRLNRKTVNKNLLTDTPCVVFAYDVLEWNNEDLRGQPLNTRRKRLETLLANHIGTTLFLSAIIQAKSWAIVKTLRMSARNINSEGIMLKHLDSLYHSGRKRGDWWKWKIDPRTIDAVLIYAQKGSGRRSGYYTDYTFAVRDGDQLVTIAKAYSGLTNQEIQEVSRFVNKNAIERFGPVRTVKPELVFEIAFEGIGFSKRHKSGVALRFPRIVRWRKDKTAHEIDDLESIKKMIT